MPHHGGHQRDPHEAKRHLALWLAVGATMTAIVAIWALLLPTQLGEFNLIGSADNAKWQAVRARSLESRKQFEESLARLKRRLDAADPQAQAAAQSVEKLKEKLNQPPPAAQPVTP